MALFKKKKQELNLEKLPAHIGVIMDGNGRWAKKRALPRSAGHKAGADALKKIVTEANELGIKYMTVYAFSTENWKRPKDEVDYLMSLLLSYLKDAKNSLAGENAVIKCIGSRAELSEEIQEQIIKTEKMTENNDGIHVNIALNYGAREEITRAAKSLCKKCAAGEIYADDITEDTLENELYTAGQPDVDLLIRTSGEMRLSNFMLWQLSYAEMYFSDKLWPDFTPSDLKTAIFEFQNRGRRFGGI